jgi:hypothetical protein
MTSVGALIRRRSLRRLPADWIAASWRPEPAALGAAVERRLGQQAQVVFIAFEPG